ncbi:MAG: class I SAM-dependent methyltransferase [Armatimonadota bacterium]
MAMAKAQSPSGLLANACPDAPLSAISRLMDFANQAKRFASSAGLTSAGVAGSFLLEHILPAITAWRLIRPHSCAQIADLGAGAGAFAFTAAILHPSVSVVAIDSSGEHCSFMTGVSQRLGVGNIRVLNQRIESMGALAEYSRRFGIIGARALGPENLPYALAAPLLRPRGALLLWRTMRPDADAVPGPFRLSRHLDLGSFSPRLALTRYDLAAPV